MWEAILSAGSGALSLLGGGAFRAIIGETSAYITKKQDHNYELKRLEAENVLADAAHLRTEATIKLQAELGAKQIQIVSASEHEKRLLDIEMVAIEASAKASEGMAGPSGSKGIDAWNKAIRPSFASVALVLWLVKVVMQGGKMDSFDTDVFCVIVGFFFVDRTLGKRGK